MEDVLLAGIGHSNAIEQCADRVQRGQLFFGGHADAQLAHDRVGQCAAQLDRIHTLRHAVDHVFAAEALLQQAFAGDAVEHGQNDRVRADLSGGVLHGLLKRRGLHGEDHQIRRLAGFIRVDQPEVAAAAVGGNFRAPVAFAALGVHHEAHALAAQMLGQKVAVEHAQRAHADDGDSFDVHVSASLSTPSRPCTSDTALRRSPWGSPPASAGCAG